MKFSSNIHFVSGPVLGRIRCCHVRGPSEEKETDAESITQVGDRSRYCRLSGLASFNQRWMTITSVDPFDDLADGLRSPDEYLSELQRYREYCHTWHQGLQRWV